MKLLTRGRLALAAGVLGLGLLSGGALVNAIGDPRAATGLTVGGIVVCLVALALTQGLIGGLREWLAEARDRQAGAKA